MRTAVMSSSSFWSVRHLSKLSCVKPACLAISNSSRHRVALARTPSPPASANSTSMSGKVLSPPAQRASIEAAAARLSSGNSRKMKRTLPVSMYFSLSAGQHLVVEVGAVAAGHRGVFDDGDRARRPCRATRSGSGPGFISSSTETSVGPAFLRCAQRGQRMQPQAAATARGGARPRASSRAAEARVGRRRSVDRSRGSLLAMRSAWRVRAPLGLRRAE